MKREILYKFTLWFNGETDDEQDNFNDILGILTKLRDKNIIHDYDFEDTYEI